MPTTDLPPDGGPSEWEKVVDYRREALVVNQEMWEECLANPNAMWVADVPVEDRPSREGIEALARYGTNAEDEVGVREPPEPPESLEALPRLREQQNGECTGESGGDRVPSELPSSDDVDKLTCCP